MDGTTMQAPEGSIIELLPTELKLFILCAMDDAQSAINLLLAGPAFYSIVEGNPGDQAVIARAIAANILDDTNPDGIKLAFMAAEARLINNRSLNAVREFLDVYVHHRPWFPWLYRLRAVLLMPDMHSAIQELLDWVYQNTMVWPVRPTPRTFSPTEVARQHHTCYTLDVGFTLLKFIPGAWSIQSYMKWDARADTGRPKDPTLREGHWLGQPFKRVSQRFWKTFSVQELDRVNTLVLLLQMIQLEIPQEGATVKVGHVLGGELRHLYDRLSFAYIHEEGWWARSRGRDICDTVEIAQRRQTIDTPFVNDPTAFSCPAVQEWIHWGSECHFKPCVLQIDDTLRHTWLFSIGDRERCDLLLTQGPIWEWGFDHKTWYMAAMRRSRNSVDWLVDPASFGIDKITAACWEPIFLRRPYNWQEENYEMMVKEDSVREKWQTQIRDT